ncbi:hypothetical protein DPMN_045964 [Dreissena polymorpha]|uniref:Uncharacterized protein n=1 Tax=Dreissena polymorpha TaxID=45954 RepID=A0A9D4I038_DREPO|nr:hypothetical protein DPMN_045964 [Dreissena polymorpha]
MYTPVPTKIGKDFNLDVRAVLDVSVLALQLEAHGVGKHAEHDECQGAGNPLTARVVAGLRPVCDRHPHVTFCASCR